MPIIGPGGSGGGSGREIAYAQITSNALITDTSESTATALITCGPATFDGSAVMAEFYCFGLICSQGTNTDQTIISLFEGSTQITRLWIARTVATASSAHSGVRASYRFTPTAGSHTYKITGVVPNTTGAPTIEAGSGGTATAAPAFLRFTKV